MSGTISDKECKITINNESFSLPVISGTLGTDVIDISPLSKAGYFTFDPGFTSTASCESKITYIDGDKGVLLHRGYPIEQLAEKSDYLELCYLLLNGQLPNKNQNTRSIIKSKATRSCMSRLSSFLLALGAMLTRWQYQSAS